MLYGYSDVILRGTLVTLELALTSVVLAVLLGLIGAGAKLSRSRPLAMIFEVGVIWKSLVDNLIRKYFVQFW